MATHIKKHIKRSKFSNELRFKKESEGEDYAEIISEKGDARFECKLLDGSIVISKAKGSISRGPKKEKLSKNDFVLLQKDECTSQKKFYLIHKYSPEDKKKLAKMGELTQIKESEDVMVAFEDDIVDAKINEVVIDDDFIASI